MTFQTLYRKYRPQRFGEVLGQTPVTTALRNAVREDRVGHAYLFSGPRGTGKTTTARILAKALNCTERSGDGEPCDRCEACVAIARGTSMDVIELDAASNRGVDDMRELIRRVDLASPGRHKVYILDEAHMLTKEAANTFLKTLEEPRPNVVFVLATTDPQKLPATIRSRTQHFEFTLLPSEALTDHLAEVAKREQVDADRGTLALVARRAAGSARDALSYLDQALAYGDGVLDPDRVRFLLEVTPFARRAGVVQALAEEDVAATLSALAEALDRGIEPRQLADDLLRYLREVFLVSAAKGRDSLDLLEEEREQLLVHGRALRSAGVIRAIETLGQAAVDMRAAPDPRLVLEVALVRLARGAEEPADVLERLDRLEEDVRRLGSRLDGETPVPAPTLEPPEPPAAAEPAAPPSRGPSDRVREALQAARARLEQATPGVPPRPAAEPAVDLDDVVLAWPRVLDGLGGGLKARAQEAQPVEVDGDTVVLGLPSASVAAHEQVIEQGAAEVAGGLSRELGLPLRIRLTPYDGFTGDERGGTGPVEAPPAPATPPTPPPAPPDEEAGVDSVSRLVDAFDATIEEERAP